MSDRPVIYEVNLRPEPGVAADFDLWLRKHVRDMLALPGFLEAAISLRADDDAPEPTRTVQYRLVDRAALDRYLEEHAPRMRAEGVEAFGDRFTADRRILESAEQLSYTLLIYTQTTPIYTPQLYTCTPSISPPPITTCTPFLTVTPSPNYTLCLSTPALHLYLHSFILNLLPTLHNTPTHISIIIYTILSVHFHLHGTPYTNLHLVTAGTQAWQVAYTLLYTI